jgi:hypothetical protein
VDADALPEPSPEARSNARRLDVDGTVELLLKLDLVRQELQNWQGSRRVGRRHP